MKSIFLSVFLCFVVAGASAQQDNGDAQSSDIEINAPAGFTWGETKQQIENKGIVVKDCLEEILGATSCMTDSAPKEISFVKEYWFVFIEGYGLQGIDMKTDEFTDADDPIGSKGKKLYDKVKQKLISKYGQPNNSMELIFENIENPFYGEHDGFYQCLGYFCGFWDSNWFGGVGEGRIKLEIIGLSKGVGYIGITYRSKDFGAILRKQKEAESIKDQEAL